MFQLPCSRVELSSAAVAHNLSQVKKMVPRSTKIGVVLKSNAYGHGLEEMVRLTRDLADLILVYDHVELAKVRERYSGPVLLLGPVDPLELINSIYLQPIFSIYSVEQLAQLEEVGRSLRKAIAVHLSIDALFGREGILPAELPLVIDRLRLCKYVSLEGVYAHFSSAGSLGIGLEVSRGQMTVFFEIVEALIAVGYKNLTTHICASSGVLMLEGRLEPTTMVRLGLALYGLWPSEFLRTQADSIRLQPVMEWISWVSQLKTVPSGYPIGYQQTFRTTKASTIAVIPIGYGNGYPRGASGRGRVLIQGRSCPILGIVSMNCLVVDVSHLSGVVVGAEVVLLGRRGEESVSAEELATLESTINYDILTAISPTIPRIVK